VETVLANAFPDASPEDRMGFQCEHYSLRKPAVLPFRPKKEWTATKIMTFLEKLQQSDEDLLSNLDSSFRIKLTLVRGIRGRGRKKPFEANLEEYVQQKVKSGALLEVIG